MHIFSNRLRIGSIGIFATILIITGCVERNKKYSVRCYRGSVDSAVTHVASDINTDNAEELSDWIYWYVLSRSDGSGYYYMNSQTPIEDFSSVHWNFSNGSFDSNGMSEDASQTVSTSELTQSMGQELVSVESNGFESAGSENTGSESAGFDGNGTDSGSESSGDSGGDSGGDGGDGGGGGE